MSRTATWVRLAGKMPASTIAAHTPPTWETLADGGTGEVALAFALSPRSHHPLLRQGTLVEVMLGAQPVASARITDVDTTTWEVKAQGLSAVDLLALDVSGGPTRDVGVAISVAQSKGWQVQNPGIAGVAAGEVGAPITLGKLLSEYAEERGMRWGVTGEARLYVRPDPTTPYYTIAPGRAAFAPSNLGQASHIVGRVDLGLGYASITVPQGGYVTSEKSVDLTERGVLGVMEATAILGGLVALGATRGRWASGVTLSRHQLTRNGIPAALPTFHAGQMVRAMGMPADLQVGGAPWADVVVGKTRYTAGSDEIYLEPVNTNAHDLADVLAEG